MPIAAIQHCINKSALMDLVRKNRVASFFIFIIIYAVKLPELAEVKKKQLSHKDVTRAKITG